MTWAGLCAGQRLCWSGASACSCGAPASARLLPAQVWHPDARRLGRWTHESKATSGSEDRRGAQPSHTAGGTHHKGENSTRGNPSANTRSPRHLHTGPRRHARAPACHRCGTPACRRDKLWDVVSATCRSFGVGPRAYVLLCARLYARVLVPPNLDLHIYAYIHNYISAMFIYNIHILLQ